MAMRNRTLCVLLVVLAVCAVAGPVFAQGADALNAQQQAKRKLLAIRAARVDAMRKLAERIKGLNITSTTTVQDFVTTDDTIQTAMRTWLLGMKEEGKPRFDGEVAEVTMAVTLRTVEQELKRIYTAHYKGDQFKISDFSKMTETNRLDKITEVGQGAVPDEMVPPPLQPTGPTAGGGMRRIPEYWKQHCTGRGRLMAERAARVDAMRRLAERLRGVRITAQTTVQDFVAQSDDVNVDMRSFLRGAKEVGVRYHRDELIVEAELEVVLRTVMASFRSWADAHYRGDRVKLRQLEEYVEKVRYDKLRETGMGVPPERYLKGYSSQQITVLQAAAGPNVPDWATSTLRVAGQGAIDMDNPNPAQAKLMAYRAAELDARRKLAERLNGLMITSDTSVQDFVAQSDDIQTRMLTFQQGAHVVDGSQRLMDDGTAEVTVEIDLKPLWNVIVYYMKQYPVR